jgi:STAGA complex 65 subunit gamma
VTELSWHSCRQLLYQAVATILAHTGFECANESVLETLTDVAHEYCLKFTKLLRFAVDREALLGQTPFPDVMEQVFHEVGIGSVLSLQKFWQHRIKDYHTYMLQVRRPWETWANCPGWAESTTHVLGYSAQGLGAE